MSEFPIVHQFTAMYADRDAVGQHTYLVDSILRELGCRTYIFGERSYRDSKLKVLDVRQHLKYPKADLIIYQMSTGSSIGDYLATRSEPLILNYHNITPSDYYAPWAPHIGHILMKAREQLARLAKQAYGAIADSQYNAKELHSLGMSNVSVVPVLMNESTGASNSNLKDPDKPYLLFVGRIAPNKRIEHLIGALALIRREWKNLRLVLVGAAVVPEYEKALRQLAERLDLGQSVEFTGSVSSEVRDRHYSRASVFVTASAHEGFCVPVIEAMNCGLPVIAEASTAITETAKNAGLLLNEGTPTVFAKAVDAILVDRKLRSRMIKRGYQRAYEFAPVKVRQAMRDALNTLFEGKP